MGRGLYPLLRAAGPSTLITVLYFSDRAVRERLFDAVSRAQKPVLVSGVRHGKNMRAPEQREPFSTVEDRWGDLVDQVVVADEGTVDGMWRDPLGDLADALYPDDRARAYAASSGYALVQGMRVLGVVKQHGAPEKDRWFLQELLAKHFREVPPPSAAERPGQRSSAEPSGRRIEDEDTNPRARRPAPSPSALDPYAVIGIARGTPKDEAKKAFRALIAQYHPDKVSHLAPEFKELADRRTREILIAWEQLEKEL